MTREFRQELKTLLPRLSRFAMALTRSRADADDLLQASCERALKRLDQWDPNTRLDSWMFRIMQTVWFNEVRAQQVRNRYSRSESFEQEPATGGAEEVEARLLLRRVEQEISALPPDQRALLVLVCVEGLTYREAAEVLSIPIGTVMSRLANARLKLMKRLETRDGMSSDNIIPLVSKWRS